MFSGIVENRADVLASEGGKLYVKLPWSDGTVLVGQSISISGCCLTISGLERTAARFDVSPETRTRTNLGDLKSGEHVNVERGLRLDASVDGHLVTGHIDSVGTIRSVEEDPEGCRVIWVDVDASGLPSLVEKGSVALDGVSLTVNRVDSGGFCVTLIPHTLAVTTLGERVPGSRVNIEYDLIAKYVQRALDTRGWMERDKREP